MHLYLVICLHMERLNTIWDRNSIKERQREIKHTHKVHKVVLTRSCVWVSVLLKTQDMTQSQPGEIYQMLETQKYQRNQSILYDNRNEHWVCSHPLWDKNGISS